MRECKGVIKCNVREEFSPQSAQSSQRILP